MIPVRPGFLPLFAIVLALVLTTVACTKRTPATWAKPGTTQENWAGDEINCRRLARRKVERDYRAKASQIGSGEYQTGNTLTQSMNRYEAKKRQRRLFEACLASQGYTKKKAAPQKN